MLIFLCTSITFLGHNWSNRWPEHKQMAQTEPTASAVTGLCLPHWLSLAGSTQQTQGIGERLIINSVPRCLCFVSLIF